MKFLIVLALIAVVAALPPRHGFEHGHHENYQIDGSNFHQNKYRQINLIKLVYQQLIERLNRPSQDENEEEERAINDIVDTINMIGEIIHDNSDNGEEDDGFIIPPKPSPEHNGPNGDVPNKPIGGNNVPHNGQEKLPPVAEVPVSEPSEVDKLSLVKTVEYDEIEHDDENNHDVLSLVQQKDDAENPFIAYNFKNAANEVPKL